MRKTDPETLLNKRQWMRKPQYEGGWDWNPRLLNLGLVGDVTLEWGGTPWVEQMSVLPVLTDDLQEALLRVRAFVVNPGPQAVACSLQLMAASPDGSGVCHRQVDCQLPPGESCVEGDLAITDPQLWWPVGHGDQPLYTVLAALTLDGQVVAERHTRTGLRTVRLDRSPHPEAGEYFVIEVNGRPIFCKGGNWVPPDLAVSAIPDERFRELVDLALGANFNLLRIWGGGYYVGDRLLNRCDERGVLVWHDLAFACSKYPGDDPAFLAEVREEVRWNVRDMASHPSLVVWCGNNELEWGVWAWGYDRAGKSLPDYSLFHHVIPVILKEEDPSRPYWPSSPFSPDHGFPNDPTVGDQHPWSVSLGEHGPDFWAYRGFVDRFPNEGGVLGASSPATLRQGLGEAPRLRSVPWEHHDNACNFWSGDPGITYALVKLWLGRDPAHMALDDYCFASALLQAEGLGEYIANYRRRMFSSSCAVFWMYNDSWPATHGWSIVDYYLRKKLAYHPVRRAFGPVTVVVCDDGDAVRVFGVNDSPEDWSGALRFGVFRFEGGTPVDETCAVTLPANMSAPLAEIPRKGRELARPARAAAFATLTQGEQVVAQHRLLRERFGKLKLARPQVEMECKGGVLKLRSETFVWGLCLDLDGERPLADNCLDLLPGVEYRIPWPRALGRPKVMRTGNDLVVG